MGQQQLLLIVLGVILVGVAVVLGIQYFSVGAEQGAKDELVAHSLTIGSNAQEWYKKPKSMGGGGNTFAGFETEFANNLSKLEYSTNGHYTLGAGTATTIRITGDPTSYSSWNVYTDVYLDSMKTVIAATAP